MTNDRNDVMVENYLSELERAAASLPANRRAELLADVRSHIAVARDEAASGGADDDAVTSETLTQLGDPRDIAAAAGADLTPRGPQRSFMAENVAILLVQLGVFLFVFGYFVGLVMLWSSRRWTIGDKLLGTFVFPFGIFFTAAVSAWLGFYPHLWIPTATVMVGAEIWVSIHLWRRAHAAGV